MTRWSSLLLLTASHALRAPRLRRPRLPKRRSAAAEAEPTYDAPGRLDVLKFAAPVAALNVANFAMGSVDTAAVGRFGTTAQLAALAPGTTGMEYTSYALSFLTTASLNLLSSISDPGGDESDAVEWSRTLGDALRVALCVGLLHGVFLYVGANPLARLLGASAASGTVRPAANYLRIRAWSAVAFHVSAVCGAAHFARKDSKTPFYTILVAGFANIVGDGLLCPLAETHKWALMPDAIAAAAVATVAAQYLGLAFSAAALRKTKRWPAHGPVWRPGKFLRVRGWKRFLEFGGPVSQLLVWRIAVYAYVGRCASLLGAVAGAAQQIMATLFWGSTTLSAEPFYAAAQTFLPDHYDKDAPDVITPQFRRALRRILDSSFLWGALVTGFVGLGTTFSTLRAFTADAAIRRAVPKGPLVLVGLCIAPMLTMEGALIVLGEFRWLVRSMTVAGLCSAAIVAGLARSGRGSVRAYWYATLAFTLLRLTFNAAGVVKHVTDARVRNAAAYYDDHIGSLPEAIEEYYEEIKEEEEEEEVDAPDVTATDVNVLY